MASSQAIFDSIRQSIGSVSHGLSLNLSVEHVGQASTAMSVFLLSATTLGAGILSIPVSFAYTGYISGLVLLLVVGVATHYSIRLLSELAHYTGAKSYEQLGSRVFPRYGKSIVSIFLMVLLFGALTAYLDIISDTLQPIVIRAAGKDNFFTHRWVLILIAMGGILPLCLPRGIHTLEKTSGFAVGIIFAFSVLVIILSIRAMSDHEPDYDEFKPTVWSNDFFKALPIIATSFTCQVTVFPVWNNLEINHEVGRVASIMKVANLTTLMCGIMYAFVGIFGYIQFGGATTGDILGNYETSSFYQVVRVIFTVAIVLHYPVVHFAFRSAFDQFFFAHKPFSRTRCTLETLGCCSATYGLAVAIKQLADLFGLTGAIAAFPIDFILPAIFYLKLRRDGPSTLPIIDEDQEEIDDLVNNNYITIADDDGKQQPQAANGQINSGRKGDFPDGSMLASDAHLYAVWFLLIASFIIACISVYVTAKSLIKTYL